mgnify:CR=1 FL=1|jgi:hypothetical protein
MGRALRPVFEIMAYGCFAELTIGKTTVLIKEGIRVSIEVYVVFNVVCSTNSCFFCCCIVCTCDNCVGVYIVK